MKPMNIDFSSPQVMAILNVTPDSFYAGSRTPEAESVERRVRNMVLFLCSEKAGFITGENICIDGGMTKQMIYHGDCGWRFDI